MNQRFTWSFQVTLLAPFVTGGIVGSDAGVDSPLLRDECGRLIISGFQISGYFRHFIMMVKARERDAGIKESESLVPWDTYFDWFGLPGKQLRNPSEQSPESLELSGKPAPDIGADMGRGRLTFRDLAKEDAAGAGRHISRIRIDKQRQSVAHGAWQVIEQFHAQDEEVLFGADDSASIVLVGSSTSAELFEKSFGVFCDWLQALGGNKAQGFGRVKKSSFAATNTTPIGMPDVTDLFIGSDSVEVNIGLNQPLLVDPQLLSGNLYRSSPHIPGGVLKAAIAELAQLSGCNWSEYTDILSELIITHAQPNRSGVVPFSAVYDESNNSAKDWFSTSSSETAMIFQADMKETVLSYLDRLFEVQQPEYLTRTRTAIQENTNRAKENQLFNYQSVNPVGTSWTSTIRVPEIFSDNQREKASQLVSFLASGLVQIGKLRADLKAEFGTSAKGNAELSEILIDGKKHPAYRITLNSTAWLLGTSELEQLEKGRTLKAIYQGIFQSILPVQAIDWNNFDFLAQHEWSGGRKAYRYKQMDDGGYHPYLLTKPGSVFVFPLAPKSSDEEKIKLKNALNALLHSGLPAANSAANWENCPFLPQNGYGQIAINDYDREAVS